MGNTKSSLNPFKAHLGLNLCLKTTLSFWLVIIFESTISADSFMYGFSRMICLLFVQFKLNMLNIVINFMISEQFHFLVDIFWLPLTAYLLQLKFLTKILQGLGDFHKKMGIFGDGDLGFFTFSPKIPMFHHPHWPTLKGWSQFFEISNLI